MTEKKIPDKTTKPFNFSLSKIHISVKRQIFFMAPLLIIIALSTICLKIFYLKQWWFKINRMIILIAFWIGKKKALQAFFLPNAESLNLLYRLALFSAIMLNVKAAAPKAVPMMPVTNEAIFMLDLLFIIIYKSINTKVFECFE